MIESLQIENFQKHHKLRIKFDPNITTIVGPSDTGKSSIVRALGWVAFNSPSGTAFIREGSKGCSVSLKTEHNTIKRSRGKSINYYDVDGKRLEAIRKGDVPEDVIDALRLDRLNFQFQHDSPLWLSDSPGEVAKKLNEIVNLDLIDRVLANLSRQYRHVDSEVTVTQNRLIRARSIQSDLQWVAEAEKEYERIESTSANLDKVRRSEIDLESVINSLVEKIDTIKRCEDIIIPAQTDADAVDAVISELKDVSRKETQLSGIVKQLREIEDELKQFEDLGGIEYSIDQLIEVKQDLYSATSAETQLTSIIEHLRVWQNRLQTEEDALAELQTQYDSIETCPICGNLLNA